MLLLLSFFILKYVSSKVNSKKIRQIENDFKNFKLAATKDELILNAVENFNLDETTMTTADVFNELLRAANIMEFIEISEKYRIPVQSLLYKWNYVPVQDSPKHILNALNDDCIQEILRKLTDASDFLSATETCQQFQMNALQCYPSKFKNLSLSVENKSTDWHTGLVMSLASNYLKIFGHLIIDLKLIDDFEEGTLNMIANYCGETLLMLDIEGNENTTANFNALSKFKNLKIIQISSVLIDSMELPENLHRIRVCDMRVQEDMQFLLKTFPNLKSADFFGIANLNQTTLNAFITFNPELRELCILNCQKLKSSVLNDISDRLSNLTHLIISLIEDMTIPEYIGFVTHLSRLQQLRYLSIIFFSLYPANILIDALVANIPKIEFLSICNCYNLREAVTGLLELSFLKILDLTYPINDNISASSIVELINGLPNLEEIRFNCGTIGLSEMVNILECSQDLAILIIHIHEIDINLSVYNEILASIKGQLEVTLEIKNGIIDENIFKENDQRLKIIRRV